MIPKKNIYNPFFDLVKNKICHRSLREFFNNENYYNNKGEQNENYYNSIFICFFNYASAQAITSISCEYSNNTKDPSKGGVLSVRNNQQELTITCDNQLPLASMTYEEVKDLEIMCSYTLVSNGSSVKQSPGFSRHTHSHKNLILEGAFVAKTSPKTRCIEPFYDGLCRANEGAPELGFTFQLIQKGGKDFQGITFSTNSTEDLASRYFEKIKGHMSMSPSKIVQGLQTISKGIISKTGPVVKDSVFENISLGNIFLGVNRQISKGECTYK